MCRCSRAVLTWAQLAEGLFGVEGERERLGQYICILPYVKHAVVRLYSTMSIFVNVQYW